MELTNQLLDTIIKTSNNNITITDDKGIILQSNPSHWTFYGLEPDEYKGKSVFQLEKDGILSPSITSVVLKEKKPTQIMQQSRTGKVFMAHGYPIFDQNGKITRVISYAQDQTEINDLQVQYEQLKKELNNYKTEMEELRKKDGILSKSKEMQHIVKTIQRVANSDATVLFLGESGVGKSMFARELHKQSLRHHEPFVEVNCSTIPESLFESEMFGYESGSFTGAQKKGKQGLIEQAHKGTLFLDEIGELPLSMQVKLLKVLQEKKYMRIGGNKERHVDFRLITATNQNLEGMVDEGKFRLDLYYRLNVIPLHIPPLRDRKDDITFLINHYMHEINLKYQTNKKLHATTYESFIRYPWPGNVRELENVLERLVLTTESSTIYPGDLDSPLYLQKPFNKKVDLEVEDKNHLNELESLPLKVALERVEKQLILNAFKQCKSTYEMAKILGISQPSVVRKLNKYK